MIFFIIFLLQLQQNVKIYMSIDLYQYLLYKSIAQKLEDMDCFGAFNTKGFSSALSSNHLPPSSHISYGGCFNQLKYSIGPKATKSLQLHIGYARAQNQNSAFDNETNDYLAIFTKGNKDGADRDQRHLNAVVLLDVSGSMGSCLNSQGQGCRIQLAKQAILMFFSKMRKTDAFGLIVFNNEAKVLIPLRKVSSIESEALLAIVKPISADGGTTLLTGLDKAKNQFKNFMSHHPEAKSFGSENRIIMLTDVEDNSISGSKNFIEGVQNSGIHTSIIGISDAFRSQVCQQLIEIKGFNYFCATELDDLNKYLFRNFDFTFFPANFDVQIKLISQNIQYIQVFGTPDAEKVLIYNIASTDNFTITKIKTSFPSELQISQQGNVKTYGGLILVKLHLKNKESNIFNSAVKLTYKTSSGQNKDQTYNVHYEAPANQQFYSQQSLYEALGGFLYAFEVKNILKSAEQIGNNNIPQNHIQSLQKLKLLVPQSKKKQLDDLIKTAKHKQQVYLSAFENIQ